MFATHCRLYDQPETAPINARTNHGQKSTDKTTSPSMSGGGEADSNTEVPKHRQWRLVEIFRSLASFFGISSTSTCIFATTLSTKNINTLLPMHDQLPAAASAHFQFSFFSFGATRYSFYYRSSRLVLVHDRNWSRVATVQHDLIPRGGHGVVGASGGLEHCGGTGRAVDPGNMVLEGNGRSGTDQTAAIGLRWLIEQAQHQAHASETSHPLARSPHYQTESDR